MAKQTDVDGQSPLTVSERVIRAQIAARRVNEAVTQFTQLRPDWRKFDIEMNRFAALLKPEPRMSMLEYMDALYAAAKFSVFSKSKEMKVEMKGNNE